MWEGGLASGLCLFHCEFLIFCDVVLSSDVYLQDTRKSPMGVEAPRGNEGPGCVHVSTPGSDDSPTPRPSGRPSGGPQLLSPFALLGQFFTQRARWCPEAIGQMRDAGPRDTPVSWLPFRHVVFSALICWEATGYEGRGAAWAQPLSATEPSSTQQAAGTTCKATPASPTRILRLERASDSRRGC